MPPETRKDRSAVREEKKEERTEGKKKKERTRVTFDRRAANGFDVPAGLISFDNAAQ